MKQTNSRQLRLSIRRARRRRGHELNIVSMIDVLTVLVFFLLVNSISVSTLGIDLPDTRNTSQPMPLHALSVIVRSAGMTLSDNGEVIASFANAAHGYDLQGLAERLRQIKDRAPQESHITLRLESGIPYEILIALMDAVRSGPDGTYRGERELFPSIAVGEAVAAGARP